MKKRNILSVMALSIMMLTTDTAHAVYGRSKKTQPSKQQSKSGHDWRAEKQAFWQKIGALADLDLNNEENVTQTLQTLREIVAKKMNYVKKAKPGHKSKRLQSKIDALNKVIAELELNTPEGKQKAQQLLNDFYTKHKERVIKRGTAKVTTEKNKTTRKSGKRPKRRKKPVVQPLPTNLQPVQPVGRTGQQGIIQPAVMPSAPPAEDVESAV